MVLGNYSVIRLVSLAAILAVTSCAQADISVNSANDVCKVTSDGKSYELQLTPPCSLVKVDYKDHDYFQYYDSKVYIVAGKPAPLAQLAKWSVTEADNCSLQSQAVIVNAGKMHLSDVRQDALTCPEIGLDEKVYRDYFDNMMTK
ncbi:MAG: hypothetical protein CML20_02360 [Rheinheimera sp.]|uniref:hypothetical protein n=1 Tax=Arsukibacterium sp. UBA3155 TaxID=1946058 RepID=UPI000C8F2474|nr:hypothetical protein [Arsukibacterium sp. UBA3155]MAD73642.1 hypothetical protein [Rheinheimera sp.]|tara:strand:+ start:211500 stop:211934 length:435 start_codon:yes stop_codon:yes gene_type:complete